MQTSRYFRPALFKFLRELKHNNNREWFAANKPRYQSEVRDPLLRFVSDFGPHLHQLSRHFVADARPVGGSLFRIYRDTRFSPDKRPFKTWAAAQFRHERGGDVHAPGFYLHLEPGEVLAATGIWHPDAETLARIRDAIVAHPRQWQRAVSGPKFKALCSLGGESLSRPPRGYNPEHPWIEDLKRKDFVGWTDFTQAQACAPDFLARFSAACAAAAPLMEFLTRAVGLDWS